MVAALVWLSLTPSPPTLGFEQSDKLGHFGAYAVVMFWFSQLYGKTARVFFALGFIALGVGLEFAQDQVGFRTYEAADMLANALGVLLGWGIALMLPTALPEAGRERR